jgi:hypothetical protein
MKDGTSPHRERSDMTESILVADIKSFLSSRARGHANAVPRRVLLDHLHALGHSTTDRSMRAVFSTISECGSCGTGYFFIVTAEDRRIASGQLHGRAMSELVREKRIREDAPQGQGELFT